MDKNYFFNRRILISVLAPVFLSILSTICAYNSCRFYVRYFKAAKMLDSEKSSVKGALLAAVLLFAAFHFLYHLRYGKDKGYSLRYYGISFLMYAGILNLSFFSSDRTGLIAINLFTIYLALMLLLYGQLGKARGILRSSSLHLKNRDRRASAVIYLLSVILPAIVLCEIWLQRQNTLRNNGAWFSSKMELKKGVVGGVTFFISRPALYMNCLHLDACHGYQEAGQYPP